MKKLNLLIILSILLITITACSSSEGEALTPFDPANWPTQVPAEPTASPTPFPKEAVELLAQQADDSTAAKAEPTSTPSPTEMPLPPTPTPLPPTATSKPTATPEPSITGVVTSYGLNVRNGPNAGFDVLGRVAQGQTVSVIAADGATGWLNIEAPNGMVGWVNPGFIELDGDLSSLKGNRPQQPAAAPDESGAISVPVAGSASDGQLLLQLRSGGDIVLLNQDGSNLRRLTTGIDPALSPDGAQVAFTRWGSNNADGSLWIANTDGSGEYPVAGETKQIKSPSWSPDSKRIAVNFQEGGALAPTSHCWDTAKGDPPINYWIAYDIETKITFDQFGVPTILICWKEPPDPHWKLRVVNVADGSYTDMPAGQYAFAPTWDPANPWRVVSVTGSGLAWTDVERGAAENLTTDPGDRGPVFSPDGKYIAVTYRQDNHWDIHRLNSDGTGRVRLTKTPLYAVVDGPTQWNNASPVFSPDASQIAFLTDRTGRWEVWVMDIDGSNQRPMFSDAVNDRLSIEYFGNDERALGWGGG